MENKKRNMAYTLTKDVGKLRQYIHAGRLGEVKTAGQNKTGQNHNIGSKSHNSGPETQAYQNKTGSINIDGHGKKVNKQRHDRLHRRC